LDNLKNNHTDFPDSQQPGPDQKTVDTVHQPEFAETVFLEKARPSEESRRRVSLSRRLFAWTTVIGLAFAAALTLFVGIFVYEHDRGHVEQDLSGALEQIQEYIARSEGTPSTQQDIREFISGLTLLGLIDYARFKFPDGTTMTTGTVPEGHSILTLSREIALPDSSNTVELTISRASAFLQHTGFTELSILVTVLFTGVILLTACLVMLFRYLVIRHLRKLAAYAEEFSPDDEMQTFALERAAPARKKVEDELTVLENAFNNMRERVSGFIAAKRSDAQAIAKFTKAVEQSPASVTICDRQWRVEFINEKFRKMTGYEPDLVLGMTLGAIHEDTVLQHEFKQLWQSIQRQVERVGMWQGEIHSARRSGERFWEQVIVTPLKDADGKIQNYLITGEDIGIRKRYEQQLLRQANYDALTGLPNRILALDRLKLALHQAQRDDHKVAVMFLDIDNFKQVNDTLGHEAGDIMLVEASRRIGSCLTGTGTLARLGGDEFLIILPGLTDTKTIYKISEMVMAAFVPPFRLGHRDVFVSTSIGIAVYPEDSKDAGSLLQHSDTAMYSAKSLGKSNCTRFVPEFQERLSERMDIESKLRSALELNELQVWYQPIVDCESGEWIAAEALLRWHSKDLGWIYPDQFIPLAEESGLIVPIGRWVLEQATAAAVRWREQLGRDLAIAVNISPRQFRDPQFAEVVRHAIENAGLSPRQLELEITERLILDQSLSTDDLLSTFDSMGVRLSVDDFGTGYSALGYLKSYPFDILKIDKSFVRDVSSDPTDAALTRAIIYMAHSLGLEVIAEGVEDQLQAEFLRAEGCDYCQGYFYGKPQPEADFIAQLATQAISET